MFEYALNTLSNVLSDALSNVLSAAVFEHSFEYGWNTLPIAMSKSLLRFL